MHDEPFVVPHDERSRKYLSSNRDRYIQQSAATRNGFVPEPISESELYAALQCADGAPDNTDADGTALTYEQSSKGW